MNTIPHMETIKKTAGLFNVSEYFIRKKVLNGEVSAIRTGRKYLVNVDKFAEYLNSSTIKQRDTEDNGCIKPVSLK